MSNIIKEENYREYLISVYIDYDPTNPRLEWDNFGAMYCKHPRYALGDKNANDPRDTINEETGEYCLNGDIAVCLPLYLFDHSGITISTEPFLCPWDSGKVGYIYATKDKIAKEFPDEKAPYEKVKALLRAEVETYDQYLRGEVYGYEVQKDGRLIHSCWGIYAEPAGILQEAKDIINWDIENEKEQEALIHQSMAL